MQPNNLTALDFTDIKSSIKSYLRTRGEFSDFDFEGSGLSYLIDTLAYNTYYTAFMANMSMNEAFIASSTVRDNIVNIAKLLNYTPRSIVASSAYLHLVVQTTQTAGAWPATVTLNKGAVATGGNYSWNRLDTFSAEVDQTTGQATLTCVKMQEGSIINFAYTVNTFAKQSYVVPTADADIATLKVSVRANESATNSDVYNKVDNITNVKATDRIYFLSETEDMRYELTFGDDVIGRKLTDGEVIDLEYLVTAGAEANDIASFAFIGKITDSNGQVYAASDVNVTIAETSFGGSVEESVESIKYNAPRYYSAQYRAVTSQDYEVIMSKIYDNVESVVAYGGDELYPPVYGKVYIAIKTKTGSKLNDATKISLAKQLRSYAMASIEPVVTDAESIYVFPKVFITYDPACSARSVSAIETNVQNAINEWAISSKVNNFNSSFSLAKFQKAITLADKCVSDVTTQVSLLKYITPKATETNTYCITTGAAIYDSAPGKTVNDGCAKEPVIVSGRFRLNDRPTVDQYFEDDGFGNLRTFYNSGNRKVITNSAAGTVNYTTGEICFGPANITGASGTNLDVLAGTAVDSDADGIYEGGTVDTSAAAMAALGDLSIPVQIIPANASSIPTPSPDTIIGIVSPTIDIGSIGTTPPTSIPLNSLTPTIFEASAPVTLAPITITNPGSTTTTSCF